MSLTVPLLSDLSKGPTLLAPPSVIPGPAISPSPIIQPIIEWKEIQRKWEKQEVLTPDEVKFVENHYNSPAYQAKRNERENRKENRCKYISIVIALIMLSFIGYLFLKEGIVKF